MEEGEKLYWNFLTQKHIWFMIFFFFFFFLPRIQSPSNSDSLSAIKNSFLWPTPKKHKNILCIFMPQFIPIFLSTTHFFCLHEKLLLVLQSPVLSIAPLNHASKTESTQCQGFFQAMEIQHYRRHSHWLHRASTWEARQ